MPSKLNEHYLSSLSIIPMACDKAKQQHRSPSFSLPFVQSPFVRHDSSEEVIQGLMSSNVQHRDSKLDRATFSHRRRTKRCDGNIAKMIPGRF